MDIAQNMTCEEMITSYTESDIVNMLHIIVKQYFYRCRCQEKLPREIGIYWRIEEFIAKRIHQFNKIFKKP